MKRLGSKGEFAVLAIIMLVAVFFRTYRFDTVPGGLTDDEALWGYQAKRVANGEIRPIFFEEIWGREPLYGYLAALLFRLFGPTILGVRAVAAVVGIATVPIFYLLVKELLAQQANDRTSASLPAILATSWLATSYWHVIYSRAGFEAILVPFFTVVAFYFMWRGIRSNGRLWFACAGFFLGAGLYTYQAGKFVPIFVCLFLVYLAWRDRDFLRSQWINMILLLGICLLVTAPLAWYAATHPQTFWHRAQTVSVFNPELNEGNPVRAFGTAFLKAAAIFNLQGDPAPERNPGRRPILDPLTSLCFLAGLVIAITKTREREYAFLWSWFLMMSLPGALTVVETPNFTRAVGALPVLHILPALAVVGAYRWVEKRLTSTRQRTAFASFLLAVPLLFATARTYQDYFGAWAEREDLHRQFDVTLIEAANVMNETDAVGAVWIWPTTSLVTGQHIFSHPDFLYHGDAPYFFLSCDERTAALDLTRMCQDASRGLVMEWKEYVPERAYEAIAADPKDVISFLLQKYGRELNRSSYEAFDVVTYQLAESPAFSIAENFEPLTVSFGDELMLTGMAFGGSSLQVTSTPQEVERRELPSGKSGWVVLRWRALTEPSRNYKVAVYLQDEAGHVSGQVDKLLLSNYLHSTRDWQVGQEEMDYYILPSWGGTAPARYKVGVTLYDAENLEVVPIVGGGQWHELGLIEIVRPLVAAEVKPEVEIEKDRGEVAPGIRLLGYDLPRREVSPGDELSVALHWQALEEVNRDYLLAVQLTDDHGEVWAERFDSPVYGTYPTTQWAEGEVLKDWHDVSLPADMPEGSYQASLAISEDEALLNLVSLERIVVRGRARQFVVPQIQHPLHARFGQAVQFLGYDLSTDRVTAGGTLQLTLYWQALQEMEMSYTVFTHLLDADEGIGGQMDSIPGRGEAPTTSWVEGEVVADEYEIVVDTDAPPGEYVIEVGMYDASTGERLPVYDSSAELEGHRVLLEATRVLVAQ